MLFLKIHSIYFYALGHPACSSICLLGSEDICCHPARAKDPDQASNEQCWGAGEQESAIEILPGLACGEMAAMCGIKAGSDEADNRGREGVSQ